MNVYSDSKTGLSYTIWNPLEFQLRRAVQEVFSRLTPVIECYYTTTPTDYPSTTWGMSVGHIVAVTSIFVDISDFLKLDLTELNVYSTTLTSSVANK